MRRLLRIRLLEYFCRFIYWRFLAFFKRTNKKNTNRNITALTAVISQSNFDYGIQLFREIYSDQRPILFHSSGRHFKHLGIDLERFTVSILNEMPHIGLVLPAIRKFPDRLDLKKRMKTPTTQCLEFDENVTPIWSGIALYSFLKAAENLGISHRYSSYALNNTLLLGDLAIDLARSETLGNEALFPCGRQSVWYNLFLADAEVVFWGVHPTKSMTMIHVAEESWFDTWKHKNNWSRITKIKYPNGHVQPFFERKEFWSLRYSQEHLLHELYKHGILRRHDKLADVTTCRARELIEFLNDRNKKGYPYVGSW